MTAALTPPTTPRSAAELVEVLRSRPGRIRLVGSGSRQQRLADAGDAMRLQLGGIAQIERLDAADQTCSVDCGVQRQELDAALTAVGLELPCPGDGTLGGLFAGDAMGAATAGGQCPRTLLLGMEAVLADGTAFKCGARVVKSVAGFDVHKLFVGSCGRLFVATRLHLRLQPRPRAEQWFLQPDLDQERALALVTALRRLAVQPAALQLARDQTGAFSVLGRLGGRATAVAAMLREHGLRAAPASWRDHVAVAAAGEVLAGLVLPSVLPALLQSLPAHAEFLWHGGGRCEITSPSVAASDAMLATMTKLGMHGHVVHGAPLRRGVGTLRDAGHRHLEAALKKALDPHGILV